MKGIFFFIEHLNLNKKTKEEKNMTLIVKILKELYARFSKKYEIEITNTPIKGYAWGFSRRQAIRYMRKYLKNGGKLIHPTFHGEDSQCRSEFVNVDYNAKMRARKCS